MSARAIAAARAEQGDGGLRDVMSAVNTRYEKLSSGHRRVIDRLLADLRFGAVVSAAELADTVGLSESTVTRAAQALGFAGYPDLQARFREQFVGGVPERVKASASELGDAPESAARRVMLEDVESVRATAELLDKNVVREIVDMLVSAKRVSIFGSRGSHGLAVMLSIGLRLLLRDVRLLSQTTGDLADQVARLGRDDALIAIAFRRVDRATADTLRHARSAGTKTIGLADHLSSPVARLSDAVLIAQLGPLRLMPSYAPGASLVNALTTAVSVRVGDDAADHLRLAERLFKSFGTYDASNATPARSVRQMKRPARRRAK